MGICIFDGWMDGWILGVCLYCLGSWGESLWFYLFTLSIHLFIYLSIYLSIHPSIYRLSTWLLCSSCFQVHDSWSGQGELVRGEE
jgi:hypothetical protein